MSWKFTLLFSLIYSLSQTTFATIQAPCFKTLRRLISQPKISSLQRVINHQKPLIMVHGKNHNIASESTWPNIIHTIQRGRKWLGGLEIDVMITKDGKLVITHDPTFHRLSKDYSTPATMIEQFQQESPLVALTKHESEWDYSLFDEVFYYDAQPLQERFQLFDPFTGMDSPFIFLDSFLQAFRKNNKALIPPYSLKERDRPLNRFSQEFAKKYSRQGVVLPLSKPLLIYIDFKPINNLARRLYGLGDWHWIRNSWDEEKLRLFTQMALHSLSTYLQASKAYGKAYIAVRHPQIAQMSRQIDPQIALMASPDSVTKQMTTEELIQQIKSFLPYHPEFVEIKYLNHMLDPKLRSWLRRKGLKVMYNHISQGDPSQFEGRYARNQKQLILDILKHGSDIIIQTNSVNELVGILQDTVR